MAHNTSADETIAHLTRLSQKPGVRSTLILSRSTGAIVRASGLVTSISNPEESNGASAGALPPAGDNTGTPSKPQQQTHSTSEDTEANGKRGGGRLKRAEDVARIVWGFFGAAGGFVDDMMQSEEHEDEADEDDGEGLAKRDEVRLLRLRMRRSEIVIVPDEKYLLVVIHDTPRA